MIVVRADEVKGIWTKAPHHRELKVLLSPFLQDVSKDLSIGMVTIPPGEKGDPHIHHAEQEVWYGLEGKGVLRIGDQDVELAPNTIVVAPTGVEHQILNPGEDTMKALFMFSPAGPEKSHIPEKI